MAPYGNEIRVSRGVEYDDRSEPRSMIRGALHLLRFLAFHCDPQPFRREAEAKRREQIAELRIRLDQQRRERIRGAA